MHSKRKILANLIIAAGLYSSSTNAIAYVDSLSEDLQSDLYNTLISLEIDSARAAVAATDGC